MKRLLLLLWLLALVLTGCGEPVVSVQGTQPGIPSNAVRTGLGLVGSISGTMHATPDMPGTAWTDVTMAAVTVDDDGVIRACAIDGLRCSIPLDATGALQWEDDAVLSSKNELADAYGMHKASTLGTDWYRQAADLAAWVVGKQVEDLRSGDVTASVTISPDPLLQAVRQAVESAEHQGARTGDRLILSVLGDTDGSYSASVDLGTNGLAVCTVGAAAVTLRGSTVTSCRFDGVRTRLMVTPQGQVEGDFSSLQPPFTQQALDLGLTEEGAFARDWCAQADTLTTLALGSDAAQLTGSPEAAACGEPYRLLRKAIDALQVAFQDRGDMV